MDAFVWFLQKNASALAVAPSNQNSLIFIAYVILCVIIKRPVFLLAFFMSCMLFEASLFDTLEEYQLYLLIFIIYSYIFQLCKNSKSKVCCGIILLLSIILAYDAFFYGVAGYYGEAETLIYCNIESAASVAHILFILSFVDHERIQNCLRGFVDSILRSAVNSDYMLLFCYNEHKSIKK